MVMKELPCPDYPVSLVEELWNGKEFLTETEVAKLDIPLKDIAWLLGRMLGHHDPTRVVARRIARDVLGNIPMPDTYRKWLDSGDETLRPSAWDAAYGVAMDTANSSSWYAASSAAWITSGNAASFAALDAARVISTYDALLSSIDAARDSVRAASWLMAMKKYIAWMVEFLKGVEI